MIRITTFSLLLLLGACFTWQCTRVKAVIPAHTELIFPLEEGQYRIMLVKDTTYTSAGLDDPVVDWFYKKEETGGMEEDLTGRTIHLLKVLRSELSLGSNYDFKPDRVWYQHKPEAPKGDFFAERIEENHRILVLKFPAYPDVAWNGNLFNNRPTREFTYQNIDTTVTVEAGTFEHCVVVMQENTQGLIRNALVYEVYAPEVGLIKKVHRVIVKDGPPDDPFNSSASGSFVEELVEHN